MKRIIFKYSLDSGMACYVWAFDFAKNGKRIPLLNSNKITAKMSSSIHLNKYDIFKIMSWGHRKQITWRQAQNSIETSPQLLETCIFETFSFIIFSCPILCSFFSSYFLTCLPVKWICGPNSSTLFQRKHRSRILLWQIWILKSVALCARISLWFRLHHRSNLGICADKIAHN